MIKIPTENEFFEYLGSGRGHCSRLLGSLSTDWVCPSCNRTLFEIMHWTKVNPIHHDGLEEGWLINVVTHHDHHKHYERFEQTVICQNCNICEGFIRKKLKLDGSLSPEEISRYIVSVNHGGHKIKY